MLVNYAIALGSFNSPGAVAEKINFHPRKGFAAERVGHIVEHLLFKRFFNDYRVGHPDDNAGAVALRHLGYHQISAGRFEGIREPDRYVPVPVAFIGIKLHLPGRDPFADIAALIFMHDPPADIVQVYFLPVQSAGLGADIGFDICKKATDPDAVGDKFHLAAVAEAVFNAGGCARRLNTGGFKYTPVFGDLVNTLLGGGAIIAFVNFPIFYGPVILSAVFINLRQFLCGTAGITAPCVFKHGFEHLNKVILRGQVKAPHPHRQFGDGFLIG